MALGRRHRRRLAMAWLLGLATASPVSALADVWADGWSQAGGGLFPHEADAPADDAEAPRAGAEDARVPAPIQPYDLEIAEAAARYALDPKLLHALVLVESAYDAQARSPAGAAGLAQLMPATAAELGVEDRFDPRQNLSGGAAYLAQQLVRFGDLRLALAAYNAGPARVAALGRVPDIKETKAYVAAVVECYLALAAGRSVRAAASCRGPA